MHTGAADRYVSAGQTRSSEEPSQSDRLSTSRRSAAREPRSRVSWGSILARGLLAGAAGVAAMTVAEKVEQAFTKRQNSYVPAHTLERLLSLPAKPDSERLLLNWAMHWGQGIALGPVRALMAEKGMRGPMADICPSSDDLRRFAVLRNGGSGPPWLRG